MQRLWDGLDPGTFTTTPNEQEDDTSDASDRSGGARNADHDAVPGRSGGAVGSNGYASSNGNSVGNARSDGKTVNPSTLLGLPKEANAGEVILVNKRDIIVLQFVVVRLVEKGILDAEEVMRMKKDANKEIRESHPDVAKA